MSKQGQIWVETVIYTLIGLSIIGLVISIIKPAIDEKRDKAVIDQSLEMLNSISSDIDEVRYYGTGNARQIELKIKNGKLEIDSKNDSIIFSMDSSYKYSELDQSVSIGKINSTTRKKANKYEVLLRLDYKGILNLTYNEEEKLKNFQAASLPYKITATNFGSSNITSQINIDFSMG